MRVIKFRFYSNYDKKMFKVNLLETMGGDSVVYEGSYVPDEYLGGNRVQRMSDGHLMQYSGLKDKNGTEIYEGDILLTDLSRPYLIVEFKNGAFMFQCHDNGKDYFDFMTSVDEDSNFTKYHEIIGNIYENPELLKEDN